MIEKAKNYTNQYALEILFGVSLAATLSSLVLSSVLGYPPCELCWYQRIFMFPLPLIYGVGMVLKDRKALVYGAPLLLAGVLTALYHNLLQWGIVGENLLECSYTAVSCADPIINWFGFLTIPLGSLLMFLALGAVSAAVLRRGRDTFETDTKAANRLLMIAGVLLLLTALITYLVS